MTEPARQESQVFATSAPRPEEAPAAASAGALIASAMRDAQELMRSYLELVRVDASAQLAEARRATVAVLTGLTLFLVSLPLIIWSAGVGLAKGLDADPWVGILLAAMLPMTCGIAFLMRAKPKPEDGK